jgi:glycosyltransferase involved in cell wall biosynthesis
MSSSKRTRVLLLIPHLGGGGAERVAENLARFIDRRRYEVHLGIVAGHAAGGRRQDVENVHEFSASRTRYSCLKLLGLIWRLRPAAILSGMAHLNVLVLLLRPLFPRKTRILVRHNGELAAMLGTDESANLFRFIYRLAYQRADFVICQSEAMKKEIQKRLQVPESKLLVLANPVDSGLIRRTVARRGGGNRSDRYLVAVGRLVPEKGFDLLLEAFARLTGRWSKVGLVIAGSGACEGSLKEQSQTLGIANRVRFMGDVSLPATLFHSAEFFVLSSRTEGIPNALLEAAAAGLPMVATPASPGLNDLLAGRDGVWLTDEISAEAITIALERALDVLHPRQRYPHPWIAPFEIARAIPAFEAAIDRAISAGR